MKRLALSFASIGLIAVSTFVPKAYADQWNKKTIITVSGDIQVPNKVLPAGTYVFKLLDSPSNRHIVQVFDKNEQHLQTTVLAIPNYRLEPTGRTVLTFYETAPGMPKPVRAWFYPGDNFGQEFVYSKAQMAEFAKRVTTTESEVATTKQPEPAPVQEQQQTQQQEVAENMQQPTPSPAEPEPKPEPPPAPQEQPQQPAPETPKTLPQTGSSLPLIGLAGLLSIGIFGLIKFCRA